MLFGELGRYPIQIEVNSRLLAFWYKLMLSSNNGMNKISCNILSLFMKQYVDGHYRLPWLEHIHSTLNKLGLTYLWQRQTVSENVFKKMIKQRMKDQYLQSWNENIHNNNICYNYRMFKKDFRLEPYLRELDGSLRFNLLRLRFSNHKLPIHSQRFLHIPRSERVCELCESRELADEFHYLFNCNEEGFARERKKALSPYFINRPNAHKYHALMNSTSILKMKRIARFAGYILSRFR